MVSKKAVHQISTMSKSKILIKPLINTQMTYCFYRRYLIVVGHVTVATWMMNIHTPAYQLNIMDNWGQVYNPQNHSYSLATS